MLVLGRNEGQSIVIGENIEITVLRSRDGRTRLGITAPKEIVVHRKEVADAIAAKAKTGTA
jgi:carbon storage regulator